MNEKHQLKRATDGRVYYSEKNKNTTLNRSDLRRLGLGVLVTLAVLGGEIYHKSQELNDNPSSITRTATLTFKSGGSNWSASELIASADGIDPTNKSNYPEVASIEQTLIGEENNNGVEPVPGKKVPIYVDVDKAHQNVDQISGYGVDIKFRNTK